MNQLGSNPFMSMEYERRHAELIREAEQYRQVQAVLKARLPKMRNTSKILARVGKELAALGASLEERFSGQPETNLAMNQQDNVCEYC